MKFSSPSRLRLSLADSSISDVPTSGYTLKDSHPSASKLSDAPTPLNPFPSKYTKTSH